MTDEPMQPVKSQRPRLVAIPISGDASTIRVLGAVRLLNDERAWRIHSAVCGTWDADGALTLSDVTEWCGGSGQAVLSWWSALLSPLLEAPPSGSPRRAVDLISTASQIKGLSPGFIEEVQLLIAPGTPFAALMVDLRDPGAVGRDVLHLRALRIVYGRPPSSWSESGELRPITLAEG